MTEHKLQRAVTCVWPEKDACRIRLLLHDDE